MSKIITLEEEYSRIAKIELLGEQDVWDLSVEDIHAYIASSMGNHNCNNPNMQNIPPKFRNMIIARFGNLIYSIDFSQFEFRACAARTGEAYLLQAFEERAELLPEVLQIAKKFGLTDADTMVSDRDQYNITPGERELLIRFGDTDIHKRNTALISDCAVSEVTPALRKVGKCVSLDSYVHTKTGFIKLRSLLPKKLKADTYYPLKNLEIVSDDGLRSVPQIYYNGKSPGVKIKTAAGRELICAPHHKFRTIDKKGKYAWCRADKLKPDAELFITTSSLPNKKSERLEEYRLVGLLIKAGKLEGGKIVFYENLEAVCEIYNAYAATKNLKQIKIQGRKELYVSITDNCVIDLFKQLQNGIPELYLCSITQDEAIALLSTLLDYDQNVGYCLQNRNIVITEQVQQLLTRLNISAWLTSSSKGKTLITWGKDRDDLYNLIQGKTVEEVDTDEEVRRYLPNHLMKKLLDFKIDFGVKSNFYLTYLASLSSEEAELFKFCYKHKLRKDRVVSVTKCADIEMADISVPGNNTLSYNGIVSHNTLGYCVSPETKILTKDLNWIPAGNLNVGDQLWGFDEDSNPDASSNHGRAKSRKWRNSEVEATGRAMLPSFKLTFDDGTTIKCSDKHQWIVVNRHLHSCWIETENLKIGDKLAQYLEPWKNNEAGYHAGYLAGLFDGEGWISCDIKNHRFQIGACQKPSIVLERLENCLKYYNIDYSTSLDKESNVVSINLKGKLNKKLEFLGKFRPERLINNANLEGITLQRFKEKTIVAIEFIGLSEMVTLQTSSRTYIADGLGAHNSVLYGAGPPNIQETLAKDKLYYSLDDCIKFHGLFFQKLPKLANLITETHKHVRERGWVETMRGRKRFFSFCPRYMRDRYAKELSEAYREAVNFLFQGGNADATKKAMKEIKELTDEHYSDYTAMQLMSVHDEIVGEADERIAYEVMEKSVKIAVECGRWATDYKVPIECSKKIGTKWEK